MKKKFTNSHFKGTFSSVAVVDIRTLFNVLPDVVLKGKKDICQEVAAGIASIWSFFKCKITTVTMTKNAYKLI